MLPYLARVLQQLRIEADISMRAMAQQLDIEHSTLSRIEHAENWPRDVDGIVAAYAELAGVNGYDVWARAIVLWDEALAGAKGAQRARQAAARARRNVRY